MDRKIRQKINKEMNLNRTINQPDLTGIYRTLSTAEYTFSLSTRGKSSKRDHMLAYDMSLNKFKRAEIIQCYLATMK